MFFRSAPLPFIGVLSLLAVALNSAFAAEQKIVIKGSNTFGEELAPALIERYRKDHANVSIDLESKGSASGFAALLAGGCDIASSSRFINEEEKRLAKSRGIKLKECLIGFYGVAVLVNSANPIKGLSRKQVRDVFTGAISNWKDVGGKDAAINLYIRNPVSGTYLGFQELAMEKRPYASSAKMLTRYADIVAAIQTDKHGIGYASMIDARNKGVDAIRINGVVPNAFTVNEQEYPYARSLWLYTRKDGESAEVKAFVRFVLGRRGQKVVSELGFVRRFEQRFSTYDW